MTEKDPLDEIFISDDDICKCGHKKLVHENGKCIYCGFIDGKEEKHKFERKEQ